MSVGGVKQMAENLLDRHWDDLPEEVYQALSDDDVAYAAAVAELAKWLDDAIGDTWTEWLAAFQSRLGKGES